MASTPLTHHEMIGLIEPFTLQGRQVDLAASDRLARRIVFRPATRPAAGALPELTETLELHCRRDGGFALARRLDTREGVCARLEVEGPDAAQLLSRAAGLEPADQFERRDGWLLGFSYRLDAQALRLSECQARIDGLMLSLLPPTMRGLTGELEVNAPPDDALVLPADLFAVLGWDWSTLRRRERSWSAQLVLRGDDARRDRLARARFGQAAVQLGRTLAEPPAQFHTRFRRQRFIAAFRRMIPLLFAVLLLVAAAVIPRLALWQNSLLRMMIFQVPPLLMMLFFCLREIPRFEIPPWPRALAAPSWRALADRTAVT